MEYRAVIKKTAIRFYRSVPIFSLGVILLLFSIGGRVSAVERMVKLPLVIDHNCLDISRIPERWILKAKKSFRVCYGHTSHGSQITSGMQAIKREPTTFNRIGSGGALSYHEKGGDLGHRGDLRWFEKTRKQLERPNNDRNIVIWSWCGGCSDNTVLGINAYLRGMSRLEKEFPHVIFIYMTGHLDGTGVNGNLNRRNNQIRQYCIRNRKVLFDFADIESYDPEGNGFLDKDANDGCFYDSNGDGRRNNNWADEWIARHPNHGWSLPRRAAHTRPLNAAMKGRAFWWMMGRLAGWDGK